MIGSIARPYLITNLLSYPTQPNVIAVSVKTMQVKLQVRIQRTSEQCNTTNNIGKSHNAVVVTTKGNQTSLSCKQTSKGR